MFNFELLSHMLNFELLSHKYFLAPSLVRVHVELRITLAQILSRTLSFEYVCMLNFESQKCVQM